MANRLNNPGTRHFNSSGEPLSGGKLNFYEPGTTTRKTTYSDAELTTPNTNPVVLSAGGLEPNIFLDGPYRVILTDENDVQVWDRDDVNLGTGAALENWNAAVTYDLNDVVYASDDNYYISLVANNIGNNPVSSPSEWAQVEFLNVTDAEATLLEDIASLTPTNSNFIVGNGGTWVAESGATARTSLGLGTGDSPQFTAIELGHATDTTISRVSAGLIAVEGDNVLMASNIGGSVQAQGAVLDDLNTLGAASTDGEFIVATGAGAFAYESGATARTSLGLGSIATQAANSVNIDGGAIDGTTIGATTPAAITGTTGTFTGAFTSRGIDDNATAERLQIGDTGIVLGSATAASNYVISRAVNDGLIQYSGGTSGSNGSNIVLYGGAHATLANDILFRADSTTVGYRDHSAGTWSWAGNTIVGSTSVAPKAIGHIYKGNSGATPATFADAFVVEVNGGSEGMSVINTDAGTGVIGIGSPSAPVGFNMQWSHDSSAAAILTRKVGAVVTLSADNQTTNLTLSGAAGAQLTTVERDLTVKAGALIGKTSAGVGTAGIQLQSDGVGAFTTGTQSAVIANRQSNDGPVIDIRQANTTIGTLGTLNNEFQIKSNGSGVVSINRDVDDALQVYRETATATNAIADFISNVGGTDTSVAQILADGTLETNTIAERTSAAGVTVDGVLLKDGGVSFDGGTNTLEDYEEGTWTPVLRGSSTAGTYETADATGTYTRIGRQVTIHARIVLAGSITGGGAGTMWVSGNPFTPASFKFFGPVFTNMNYDAATDWVMAYPVSTDLTKINFIEAGAGVMSIGDAAVNQEIAFTLTYEI